MSYDPISRLFVTPIFNVHDANKDRRFSNKAYIESPSFLTVYGDNDDKGIHIAFRDMNKELEIDPKKMLSQQQYDKAVKKWVVDNPGTISEKEMNDQSLFTIHINERLAVGVITEQRFDLLLKVTSNYLAAFAPLAPELVKESLVHKQEILNLFKDTKLEMIRRDIQTGVRSFFGPTIKL